MIGFRTYGSWMQQNKQELLEKFNVQRTNMKVATDTKCRSAMLYAVLNQYLQYLKNTTALTISEQNSKLESIISQIKSTNKNFLSEVEWNKLYDTLTSGNQTTLYSPKERIQRSFVVQLPVIFESDQELAPDSEKIEKEIKEKEITAPDLHTEHTLDVVKLTENTLVYLDGYYSLVTNMIKQSTSEEWFQTL